MKKKKKEMKRVRESLEINEDKKRDETSQRKPGDLGG
jgi:hypothetical protein